jgi:folate-binding protein YgfZ
MSFPHSGLPIFGLLRFSGPDAVAFLQGQISNDARRLAEGEALLAAYSNPQGRVIAVLHLLPYASGILAVLPRELVEPVGTRLRKFVLRAKVEITDVGAMLAVAGAPSADAVIRMGLQVPEGSTGCREADGFVVTAVAGDAGRFWVIGPPDGVIVAAGAGASQPDAGSAQREAAPKATDLAETERAWRLADVRAGVPHVYRETSESFVAQMLNLDVLGGISFTKGCYTGQEIIARTQHLGRIKRRMLRLELPRGEFQRGDAVRLPDGRSGRLTEFAATGDGFEALAVVALEAADSEEREGVAVALRELPLPYAAGGAAAP